MKQAGGFFSWIEQVGNRMPHPMALFLYIIAIVLALSLILSSLQVSALHPTSGETIAVVNLVSLQGLMLFATSFVENFQRFPVLGVVIILGIATGFCDRSGFFSAAIKMGLSGRKGNIAIYVIATISVLSNQAGDAAFILIPAIAGAIFYGIRRHPLAGVFLGYAAVGGGFSTALIPGGWDIILTPISIQSAASIRPDFDMPLLNGYFFLFVSALLVILSASIITIKVIEPMLGTYHFAEQGNAEMSVSEEERRGVRKAGRNVLIFLIILVLSCIPQNSFLRNPNTHSLIFGAPLMQCLQFIIIIIFSIAGLSYAISVKKIKNISDAYTMMSESIASLAGFIALAVVIGQFLFLFDKSHLAQILAIKGGGFLAFLPIPSQIIVVCFLLLTALINLFIGSGGTKWLLMGPIFIPMLMQLNIHPAFTQAIYRLGDCSTNHLTPLFAYFAILLTTAQRYDKHTGMGTLFAAMLPYSLTFLGVFILQVIVWMTFDLPVGPGGVIWLS
ncbi:AbgT family transporter [Edwardsiella tarda]|uniref:AbgT family transporter n=1 Tax=Edwardsiella tarda TaxID=636 RepID=UPI00351C3E17